MQACTHLTVSKMSNIYDWIFDMLQEDQAALNEIPLSFSVPMIGDPVSTNFSYGQCRPLRNGKTRHRY